MKDPMSYQEKQSILSLVNTFLILSFYSLYVYNNYIAGNLEIIYDMKFLGKAFMILIPFTIVVQIVMHILFVIFNKEGIPKKIDEMDKLIELKSIRVSHWVFIVGFFTAMASQAFGMAPYIMFLTFVVSGFLAGMVSDVSKIWYYRKGV
ncbi:hypothetical protein [Alkalitalea saponilacus]|uniref:Uncharacterized protein n=1 Tax=Alkalitalea saponilacus TaxID=889453 RepID=A0A1T5DX25_9BACT|nr:hypothetical protein [Alkalitalea saponilacus]ASB49160.1 hypothetical protein CDL62_08395 [Alkalitalea saponilacus]SKB76224.1 hypothetical protein SAMN03080601_01152 [Alkalitalea saponilacus]